MKQIPTSTPPGDEIIQRQLQLGSTPDRLPPEEPNPRRSASGSPSLATRGEKRSRDSYSPADTSGYDAQSDMSDRRETGKGIKRISLGTFRRKLEEPSSRSVLQLKEDLNEVRLRRIDLEIRKEFKRGNRRDREINVSQKEVYEQREEEELIRLENEIRLRIMMKQEGGAIC